jgi:hypothetical protein
VLAEPRILGNGLVQKPDIVAHRGGTVIVADTQVVSGATPLEIASERKRAKYNNKTFRILPEKVQS